MSQNESAENTSYWPGYVDAVINIVLNILFMVALLIIALSTMDFSASTTAGKVFANASDEQAIQTKLATITPKFSAPASVTKDTPLTINVPSMPYKTKATNVMYTTRTAQDLTQLSLRDPSDGDPPLLTIEFHVSAVQIPSHQVPAIQKHLKNMASKLQQNQWLIWTKSNAAETVSARLAYARVMSVRANLINAGIPPTLIQTRILDVRDTTENLSSRVMVTSYSS